MNYLIESFKTNSNRCVGCKTEKRVFNNMIDEFNFTRAQLFRQYSYCRECWKKKKDIYNFRDKRKDSGWDLTYDQYCLILKKQKGLCAICKKEEYHVSHYSKETMSLTVDDCHKTGKIRGLLCRNCNLMLGHSKDDILILRRAARYLKK